MTFEHFFWATFIAATIFYVCFFAAAMTLGLKRPGRDSLVSAAWFAMAMLVLWASRYPAKFFSGQIPATPLLACCAMLFFLSLRSMVRAWREDP